MVQRLLSALIFMIVLVNIVWQCRYNPDLIPKLSNSDALYLPAIFADIFSHRSSINDWYLTPAPYFFPDYFIYSIAYLLSVSAYQSIIVYAIIQNALLFVGLIFISSQVAEPNGRNVAVAIISALIWFACGIGLPTYSPFGYNLASAHHYGEFVSTILLIGLLISIVRDEGCYIKRIFAISTIAFLSALSDNLFIVHFLAPLLIVAALYGLKINNISKRSLLCVGLIICSTIAGSAFYSLLVKHQTRYKINLGVDGFYTNIKQITGTFIDVLHSAPIYSIFLAIYATALLDLMRRLMIKRSDLGILDLVVLFSVFSILLTITVVCLVSDQPFTGRYLIPCFTWPIIVSFFLVGSVASRGRVLVLSVSTTLFLASLTVATAGLIEKNGASIEFYPNDIACIDSNLSQLEVSSGIAGYWDSKYIQVFSRLDLNLAQHSGNIVEQRWITSSNYFRPTYDFAVINDIEPSDIKISIDALYKINGPPISVVSCGQYQLLIYGHGKLRNR